MGVLTNLADLRYTKAVEDYVRVGGKANAVRSGAAATTSAVVARAAHHAENSPATGADTGEPPPQPTPSMVKSALMFVAKGVQTAIAAEQALSAPFGKIPFPAFPALRVFDLDVGLPHAHNHPPNLVPPSPVPIPLPSMGPLIPIPILSGAPTVLINGLPAARCGDMGLAAFCGGFFPMYEVFLGSANTWIEGARAGRLLVDITKHCTFSAPKPSDPPLGPMVGMTMPPASSNVMIGGVPMPSLFSLAVAQAFNAVFKVGGAILRKATAKSYVKKLLQKQIVLDSAAGLQWIDDMTNDLTKIASTRTGREVMKRIEKSGKKIEMLKYDGTFLGPDGLPIPEKADHFNAWAQPKNPNGLMDMSTGLKGAGSDAEVSHAPANWANHPSGGVADAPKKTTSDAILLHEMNHAANATEGGVRQSGTMAKHGWDKRWKNFEEYNTVAVENGHRASTGLPPRTEYGPLP